MRDADEWQFRVVVLSKTHRLCRTDARKTTGTLVCPLPVPVSSVVQDLLGAKRDLRLKRHLKRLSRFEVLSIDDL
jgi:hypothetical protein